MHNILEIIKHKLVVSCQAEEGDPFNSPEGVTLMAKAAVMGGAAAIRSRDFDKTKMITESVDVPVIGLTKDYFPDGTVRITGSFNEAELILKSGCHMIAIDGTFRERENLSGPDFISEVKKKFNCLIMADISTAEEAAACENAGADCVSTTLSGYTPYTQTDSKLPDYELVKELTRILRIPVIAEGRINTPENASLMITYGAWSIVVGTAITRPRVVTSWYADAIKKTLIKN